MILFGKPPSFSICSQFADGVKRRWRGVFRGAVTVVISCAIDFAALARGVRVQGRRERECERERESARERERERERKEKSKRKRAV